MAYLYRLIRRVLILAVVVFSAQVQAYVPYTTSPSFWVGSFPTATTPQGGCNKWVEGSAYTATLSGTWANYKCTLNTGYQQTLQQSAGTCPAHSTESQLNGCTCTSGYYENGGSCTTTPPGPTVDELACSVAASGNLPTYVSVPGQQNPGGTVCGPVTGSTSGKGCQLTLSSTLLYITNKTTGQQITEGDATISTTVCNLTTSNTATADSCVGGSTGEVNGQTVCVKYDPSLNVISSTQTSTTASTSASTASGTTTTQTTSSSTKTDTSCDAGTCTTTNTTTSTLASGGTNVTTTQTQEPFKDFCQSNPTASVCKTESTFAGSCDAGFACSGDAAMCAAAKASHEQNCILTKTSPESALYDQYKSATGTGIDTETVSVGSFNSSNSLGVAGACIPDLTVVVWGSTVALPFSQICDPLATLGTILLAVSWLAAFAIVGRGN